MQTWIGPADYARAVRGLGEIVASAPVGGVPSARVRMLGGAKASGWAAAQLLGRLAEQDARRPDVRALAMQARAAAPSDQALARGLHQFVKDRVRFVREPGEIFQGTILTLTLGAGDCDDSARALYALARAAGLRARLAFLVQQGQPAHVFCQMHTGPEGWCNAETTIAAEYGEAPLDAARRLGIRTRSDLDGRAVTLGSLGGSVTRDASTYRVRPGLRFRFVLEVGALSRASDVRDGLTDVGFVGVRATLDRASLDPARWPADWVDSFTPTQDAQRGLMALCFAEGTYAGDQAMTLNRTMDFARVRDVRVVDLATESDQPPDTSDAAIDVPDPNAPLGFGVGATGMPIGTGSGGAASSDGGAGGASSGGGDEPPPPPPPPRPLPDLLPDPTDTQSPRSKWAAAALAHGWRAVFGDAEPYDDRIEQAILAIANVETQLGRQDWSDPFDEGGYSLRYNFGNVHGAAGIVPGTCAPGNKKHGDTVYKGASYTTCFRAYKNAVDGMAGLVRTLCGKGRENTRAALRTGSAIAVANAMRENWYYGRNAPDEQRDLYARGIADGAKVIAKHLGRPLAVGYDGPPPPPSGAGVLGALAAIAVVGGGLWHLLAVRK